MHESSSKKPLTSRQRRALHMASRKGGAPIGTAKDAIRTQVAKALLEREWVKIANRTVLITRAGRAKLNEPIPEDPDVFLRVGDGLTTRRDDAVITELILDANTLQPFWKEQALRNEAAAKDARDHAKALRRSLRNWPTTGPCGPVVTRFDPGVIRQDEAA